MIKIFNLIKNIILQLFLQIWYWLINSWINFRIFQKNSFIQFPFFIFLIQLMFCRSLYQKDFKDSYILGSLIIFSLILKFSFKILKDKYQIFNRFRNPLILNTVNDDPIWKKCIKDINEHFDKVLYPSQIETAWGLTKGKIIELATGEGKSLAILLASYYLISKGERVIVLTVNDYLVDREFRWSLSFWKKHRIISNMISPKDEDIENNILAYKISNILYVYNAKIFFNFISSCTFQGPHFEIDFQSHLICDEVDMVFIDNASIPFIESKTSSKISYLKLIQVAISLFYHLLEDEHYTRGIDNELLLTEKGFDFVEEWVLNINFVKSSKELYSNPGYIFLETLQQVLQAFLNLKKGIHYIVEEDQIVILNNMNGRLEWSKRYQDPLHSILEIKESVPLTPVSQTNLTLYYQHFINSFKKISGTSGTVNEVKLELKEIYGINSHRIKSYFNSNVTMKPDRKFLFKSQLYKELNLNIRRILKTNLPVLIIASDLIYLDSLEKQFKDIKNLQRIDALTEDKEEEMISKIGIPGYLTLATHVTGRGSDVILGGDWKILGKKFLNKSEFLKRYINNKGGLQVFVVGLNPSYRVDRQALGRTARQGLNGSGVIFWSLKDQIINELKLNVKFLKLLPDWFISIKWLQKAYSWNLERDRRQHAKMNHAYYLSVLRIKELFNLLSYIYQLIVSEEKNKIQIVNYLDLFFRKIYKVNLSKFEIYNIISQNFKNLLENRLITLCYLIDDKMVELNQFYEEILAYSSIQFRYHPKYVMDNKLLIAVNDLFDTVLLRLKDYIIYNSSFSIGQKHERMID